jgi:hypothetical protein
VVSEGYDHMAARYAEWQARILGDPRDAYVERLLARLPPAPDILEIAGEESSPHRRSLGAGVLWGSTSRALR